MGRILAVRGRSPRPSPGPSPGFRRRRLGAVVVALAVSAVTVAVGAAPAAPAPAGDPRARRAELLVEAAELLDRLEETEASVVAAQFRASRAADALAAARGRVRARAVAAYMRGLGAEIDALVAPGPYLDVVAAKEREVMAGFDAAARAAADEQRRAEEATTGLRAARASLAALQAELDVRIAADDARRAEERRRGDEARAAALARQAAADADARRRALATSFGGSPGGYAPSPLDPAALLPRHRSATERQLALMARLPFGPVPAGLLPVGVLATGQRVEGSASWYGPGFNGRPTASGAIYDQEAWTVASRELPLGTLLLVRRGDRQVMLLVNDRGPYVDGRVLDLSAAAARFLGVSGVAVVSAEVVAEPRPV